MVVCNLVGRTICRLIGSCRAQCMSVQAAAGISSSRSCISPKKTGDADASSSLLRCFVDRIIRFEFLARFQLLFSKIRQNVVVARFAVRELYKWNIIHSVADHFVRPPSCRILPSASALNYLSYLSAHPGFHSNETETIIVNDVSVESFVKHIVISINGIRHYGE